MNAESSRGFIKDKALRTTLATGLVLAGVGAAGYAKKDEINGQIRDWKGLAPLCDEGIADEDFFQFRQSLPSSDTEYEQSVI